MSAEQKALAIADKIVPAYRDGGRRYSCTGNVAKMWQAAYDGALTVLTPEPIPARPLPVGEEVTALIQWARDQMALPDGSGWLGGHIDENHRYKLRDMVEAIDARCAQPADVAGVPVDAAREYFERGFLASYAWHVTKREGETLSDAVLDHAWDNREEGGPLPALTAVPKAPQTDTGSGEG